MEARRSGARADSGQGAGENWKALTSAVNCWYEAVDSGLANAATDGRTNAVKGRVGVLERREGNTWVRVSTSGPTDHGSAECQEVGRYVKLKLTEAHGQWVDLAGQPAARSGDRAVTRWRGRRRGSPRTPGVDD